MPARRGDHPPGRGERRAKVHKRRARGDPNGCALPVRAERAGRGEAGQHGHERETPRPPHRSALSSAPKRDDGAADELHERQRQEHALVQHVDGPLAEAARQRSNGSSDEEDQRRNSSCNDAPRAARRVPARIRVAVPGAQRAHHKRQGRQRDGPVEAKRLEHPVAAVLERAGDAFPPLRGQHGPERAQAPRRRPTRRRRLNPGGC
mmetsp:Transcript_20548/g.78907  ORF Transcript_20548/g.78907 Transcript_20548/m.78907 type:complete len:206 (+) Transcript_20548:626-1243(+)